MNDMLVVTREAKKIFSVICDNSQSQSNFFREKLLAKTYEVYKATRSSPAVLNVANFLKSCVTTDKGHDTERPLLSIKENIGIDAWHEIRKKFTE